MVVAIDGAFAGGYLPAVPESRVGTGNSGNGRFWSKFVRPSRLVLLFLAAPFRGAAEDGGQR
jgi:hypothetical protein